MGMYVECMQNINMFLVRKTPDLDNLIKKLQRKRATLDDTITLCRFVKLAPTLVHLLQSYSPPLPSKYEIPTHASDGNNLLQKEFIEPLKENVTYCNNFIILVEHTLLQETPVIIQVVLVFFYLMYQRRTSLSKPFH